MSASNDLTGFQATDLARHLLGAGWIAYIGIDFAGGNHCLQNRRADPGVINSPNRRTLRAKSWQAAFELAGAGWPAERGDATVFAQVGDRVMLGDEQACVARSKTMARRICNALNSYTPNARGY